MRSTATSAANATLFVAGVQPGAKSAPGGASRRRAEEPSSPAQWLDAEPPVGTASAPVMVVVAGALPQETATQATTRGGRVMDHVLQGKAVFKESTDAFGTGAIIAGAGVAIAGQSNTAQGVGLGLVAAGLVSKIISAATTPAADTRSWSNLPNLLSFAALRMSPGPHSLRVEFRDAGGRVVVTRDAAFHVVPGRDTVLFLSDRNS